LATTPPQGRAATEEIAPPGAGAATGWAQSQFPQGLGSAAADAYGEQKTVSAFDLSQYAATS
jgi:hypothetical protein